MMGGGIGALLIASAAGYWVLTQAGKERGREKQIGRLLGLLIIVVSLGGALYKVYVLSACRGMACPVTGKGLMRMPSGLAQP